MEIKNISPYEVQAGMRGSLSGVVVFDGALDILKTSDNLVVWLNGSTVPE